ncbi:sugar transferase [Nocardioides scoriae]|uniref:sugar transferase n=1 Tax=Nocardioides scoriae TaxID=642780 RepID=UPI0012F8DD3A|nr:sugar transferase [Nocardioides scoriae]
MTARSPRLTRQGLRYLPLAAVVTDLLLVALSVVAAYVARSLVPTSVIPESFSTNDQVLAALPIIVLAWLAAIYVLGGYRPEIFGAGVEEYKRVITPSLVTAAGTGIAAYMLMLDLSRGFFLLTFLFGIPILVLGRWTMRRAVQRARRAGRLQQRVLIAGTEGHVDEIASVLGRETWLGYDVVGALTPQASVKRTTGLGVPLLGESGSLAQAAIDQHVDVVFLAGGAFSSAAEMRRLAWDLEHADIQVVIAPSVTDVSAERVSVRPVGGLPLIHLDRPRGQDALRRAKRSFDVVVSALLLLALSPVFAWAAWQVRRDDRTAPVLFRQPRAGREGVSFSCLKFRTMVVDAEEVLADLHAEHGYSRGLFKLDHDPRVTRPGRFLRRYSLDELPQLVNVLRGDMSLVGPRPPLQHEVAQYDDDMARRLHVRPGMTGLWQVSGRSDLSWSEAIRLDLYYVDNWSMVQDLVILFRTFRAVLTSRGAR